MDSSTTLSFTAGDRLLPADVRDYGFFDVTTGATQGQSGTFDAGAQIGIWYESWLGTFSSTAVDFARTLSAPHEGKVGPIFIYEVKGGDAPSGQPLPGVLATRPKDAAQLTEYLKQTTPILPRLSDRIAGSFFSGYGIPKPEHFGGTGRNKNANNEKILS